MNTKRVIAVFFRLKYQEIKDSFFLSKEGIFLTLLIASLLSLQIAAAFYEWAKIGVLIVSGLCGLAFTLFIIIAFIAWIADNISKAKRIVAAEERDSYIREI